MTNKYKNTEFYGYGGWRFCPTREQPIDPIFKNGETLTYYIDKEHPTFLVCNKDINFTDNIYPIDFMETFPKYELFEKTVPTVQELSSTVYQELGKPNERV